MAVLSICSGTRIDIQEAAEVIRPFLLFVFELSAGLARGPAHIVEYCIYLYCPVNSAGVLYSSCIYCKQSEEVTS
jgi:hypothetical protein